jgi:hypothetical protein
MRDLSAARATDLERLQARSGSCLVWIQILRGFSLPYGQLRTANFDLSPRFAGNPALTAFQEIGSKEQRPERSGKHNETLEARGKPLSIHRLQRAQLPTLD